MQITFTFDEAALRLPRELILCQGKGNYAIKPDPIFEPLQAFLTLSAGRYRFRLIDLLHVTAVKMMQWRRTSSYERTLFASGCLYLALDQKHPDLRIQRTFGDFTSGFSHQFGVAVALMS